MGYSCESAHLQYRPVRSDRNQRSWSTEPLQLLDSHQPQATTATDRSCTSDSTTTTITNRSPAANQPPWATTSPTRWNLRTEPTPEGTVAAPVTKRRTSPTEPIAVTSSRWHSSLNLLRAPTAVFDGYSTIVLEKLSRFISRHVAAPQHATPPSVPAIPTTRTTTKTTSRSAASPMAHTVTPSSRSAHGSSTNSSTVRRHDDEPCRSEGEPVPLGHRAHRQPTQFHAPSVHRDVAASPTTSRPASSHHLKYEVEFLLQQQWFDPRLRYANQSQYEYLNAIHHHEDIWLPDTYFIMHGDFKDPIIPMHFALRIYRNGTINYLMRRHLILSCQGRLNIFPFDDPLCSFALESISYEQSAITYVWKNDEDTLRKSPSLTTLNAYLIQNQTIACPIKASWRGNYSCLKVDLIFTRDRAFYFTTVFIPGIILVTSSFITFWLEWNAVPARSMIGNYSCLKVDLMFTRDRAFYFTTVFIPGIILVTSSFITFWLEWNAVPARVMIGVTTMLNFFTTSNGFRSTLPVVSNLTAMNVWDGVCMCFIYASLLEFVCVNYVGRKRPLHNVVYRPGENPVTQMVRYYIYHYIFQLSFDSLADLSRTKQNAIDNLTRKPQETIDREFHTAIAAEKTTPATAASVAAATAGRLAQTPPHRTVAPAATAPPLATAPIAQPTASAAAVLLCEEGLATDASSAGPGLTRRRPTVETKLNEAGLMETSFTCFVQVRKKEPPHPIRVAKTIDVIARITFPSAYAVFLIFFFIHYKGFS
uniref:Neurotransmitter-gated ion-channel ligand-binding domain-containing protein n=1 Tax=Anopheles melas TaxID=34690 RepID=A0A182TJ15_9DIPT